MAIVEITSDFERSKKIYESYFRYEWKRNTRRFPFFWILGLGLLLIIPGLVFDLSALLTFGVIIYSMLMLVSGFYLFRYRLACVRNIKQLKSLPEESLSYIFEFDETGLTYRMVNQYYQLQWQGIDSFEENGTEIYLFTGNRELKDIISSHTLGEENFRLFKELLTSIVTRTNTVIQ